MDWPDGFHLPLADNDGKECPEIHFDLLRNVIAIAGGATTTPAHGFWYADDGTLHDEKVIRYTVAVKTGDGAKAVYLAANIAAAKMDQKALYFVDEFGTAAVVPIEKED